MVSERELSTMGADELKGERDAARAEYRRASRDANGSRREAGRAWGRYLRISGAYERAVEAENRADELADAIGEQRRERGDA